MSLASPAAQPAAYFGKIPLLGDFVTRRINPHVVATWDTWLRHGLYSLNSDLQAKEHLSQYPALPVWNFVLPAAVSGVALVGLIGASGDRVGRVFPFTVFHPLDFSGSRQLLSLRDLVPFFQAHAPIMRSVQQRQFGLPQLEEAVCNVSGWIHDARDLTHTAHLRLGESVPDDERTTVKPDRGAHLPWPELSLPEMLSGATSYWWTNQTAGGPLKAFTHQGGLNEQLFKTLFYPHAERRIIL